MIRVMVGGYFDPLHPGHLDHISKAKKLGDWLIVSVNPDEDCIRKKGYCFMPQKDRIAIIKALRDVDEVVETVPNNGSQAKTLEKIKPNIFAKGGDRAPDKHPIPENEIEICQRLGIRIIYGIGEQLGSSRQYVQKIIDMVQRQCLTSY